MSEIDPLVLPKLSLQSVPASHGILWIRRGFATFGRYPLGFAGLFSAMMLMWILVAVTPILNMVGTLMLMPWFSLGFMVAAYRALRSETPSVSAFFAPFRGSREQLLGMLKLGALFAMVALALIALATLINADALAPHIQTMAEGKADIEALAKAPEVQQHVLACMSLISLASAVFWHTPGLVFWGRQPVLRAVVFSVMALWRNKGAFIVYGLTWLALSSTLSFVLPALMDATGTISLMPLAIMLSMTILNSILYLSAFFSFTGCFVPADATPSPPPAS